MPLHALSWRHDSDLRKTQFRSLEVAAVARHNGLGVAGDSQLDHVIIALSLTRSQQNAPAWFVPMLGAGHHCRACPLFVTLCREMGTEEFTSEKIDQLVDEYRDRCLWFLRRDLYPTTLEERLRVLGYIERYGDLSGFQRAARARQWLLQSSRRNSAAS